MSGTTAAGDPGAAGVPAARTGPPRTGSLAGRGADERAGKGTGKGGNRWIVLIVLCASLLIVAVDATVLHVAVPAVSEDLKPGSVQLLWIVDVYPLVCASLLILFGTLGDRVGRRRVLLFGYGIFALASVFAAYADTAAVLIGARALLGVGGAMVMPATLSILREVFPERRERALAIGIWSAVAAVGAAVGPLVGGLLLEHFWWGSVFLVNIPLMAAGLVVGRWLLPESFGGREGPWDLLGALMAVAGLFGVILGIKQAGSGDLFSLLTVVPLLAGAALMVLFVQRQRQRPYPLIDFRTVARPAFGTALGCIVLTVLALVGLALLAAQYLQLILGLSPLQTGLRLLPLSVAAVAAGLIGSRMLRLLGPRVMVALGFTMTALAVIFLTTAGQEDRPALLIGSFVVLGFGLETTLFGCYESMLSEAPADQAGGAAAVGETAYQLGAGVGIALLGSVMNAAYAPGVREVKGVPRAAADDAGHSLGEAYSVSAGLGGSAGEALREAAREAFVHGLHVTLAVSTVLLLLGGIAALKLPRSMEGAAGASADGSSDSDGNSDSGDFPAEDQGGECTGRQDQDASAGTAAVVGPGRQRRHGSGRSSGENGGQSLLSGGIPRP